MKFTMLSVTLRGVAHVLKNEAISKWAQKVLLTGIAPTPQESISPEVGIQMGIRAEDVNLSHLGLQRVSYDPKGIFTEAIKVTPENIGKLSLEFDDELFYTHDGFPYFIIDALRGTEEAPKPNAALRVFVHSWIVVLRNEIHVFHAREFEATFEIETFESKELREEFEPSGVGAHDQIRGEIFGHSGDSNIGKPGAWLSKNPEPKLSDQALWATEQISADEHERRIAEQ